MKKALLFFCCITTFSFSEWQQDFGAAKRIAKEKHRLILLNFSGSDWCVPCMKMKKNIFETEQFSSMADSTLILVKADFPRSRKHQLSPAIKKQNEALADKYNPGGKFPFTLLLDADGKIIRSWDGLPDLNAAKFAEQIKNIADAIK